MKEESVFWLGGKPGAQRTGEPLAAGLEPAVREACRAHGLVVEDFVAALGHEGSWLVHFFRGNNRQRIVWNGRDRRLVLQSAVHSGGWEDLRDCAVAGVDEASFAAGIATLAGPDGSKPR